jgi:hypothetical protein
MHRTGLRTWVLCAGALLGCATDPTSDTTNADASDDSGESESDSGESESGEPEGCTVVSGCADGEYCTFSDWLCGAGEPGVCATRPSECGNFPVSECGCDGVAYTVGCAAVSGVDRNFDGTTCPAPAGYFHCGPLLCNSSTYYCRIGETDVADKPNSYGCATLPIDCGDLVDCACLVDEACSNMCEATGPGFTLTCPGG